MAIILDIVFSFVLRGAIVRQFLTKIRLLMSKDDVEMLKVVYV